MSAKAISEQTGKEFLYKYICTPAVVQNRFRYASVTAETDWDRLTQQHPWLLTEVKLPPHETNYMLHVTETLYVNCETLCLNITEACDLFEIHQLDFKEFVLAQLFLIHEDTNRN